MARRLTLRDGERDYQVAIEGDDISVDGMGTARAVAGGDGEVRVGDEPSSRAWVAADGDARWVFVDGVVHRLEAVGREARRRGGGHHGTLMAPMPATVVRVQAAVGQAVARGDVLIILEAMKMELPVKAPADGTVTAIHCREGELVQPGVTLVELAS